MIDDQAQRLKVEAMRLARLAAKREIKDRGLSLKDFEAREINQWAEAYLVEHRASLIGEATIGLLCANLLRDAQKSKARSTGLSVVQISRPKVEA